MSRQRSSGTAIAETASANLLTIVRGERRWGEAEVPGISVDLERWSLSEAPLAEATPVHATLTDVAQGFQEHLDEPEKLRRWAFVVLNASNSIELDEAFESTEEGEALLEAMWDAAFGRPISPAARRIVGDLAVRHA